MDAFDYLIIGAGAAGSVLAARLSEDPAVRVGLIEAGPDYAPGHEPADIRSVFPLAAFNPGYMWPDTRVHWGTAQTTPAVPFPQGKLVGGSSSVMGMWALRGAPADYDEWAAMGAAGWDWQGVLPYFRKLESDQDFGGPLHGADGPIPIRREPVSAWSPLAKAVRAEADRRDVPTIEDLNADFRDGHCVMPNSRYADSRAGAGICYLSEAVRSRPNLMILSGRTVEAIAFEGRRATGVKLAGEAEPLGARETIVTAGALRTPILLQKSGVGPGADLRAAGVEVIADRAGVGQNLQNHAVLYVCALLNRAGRESEDPRPAAATYLRWSDSLAGPPLDMAIYVRSYLAWHALGRRMASLAPSLQKPFSRGRISLDPSQAQGGRIEFNLLSDPRDLERMKDGFRRAVGYFNAPSVRTLCGEPFVLTNATKLMRYNQVTPKNAFVARLGALAVDANEHLGLALLRRLADLHPAAGLAGDDDALSDYVIRATSGVGHVSGTCRMGALDDPLAVCDAAGAVIGVSGLRVADASVMPSVPSGNTHIPTVMVAEKIAQAIRSERGNTL
jgi:5-(hydroxymethyl)furfural/furfural oxidase